MCRLAYQHEIRDPIHAFIGFDSAEHRIIGSLPFQRLRNIHQLALTYLVYPGATHRRFEHSLGVMELATRIFDVITDPDNIEDESIRHNVIPHGGFDREYWRRVLRMAALCHDLGHLPFSHAGEYLLTGKTTHEHITAAIIQSEALQDIWNERKVQAEDIVKLAVKPSVSGLELTAWEGILAEIISSDNFGADRMDYLLRDSLHLGVAYGRFDHYRLIDSLRILPSSIDGSEEPVLGIEQGGIQSAEAMLLARYFMFSQVYFHHVRRIYDIHLRDFLAAWLPNGKFPMDVIGMMAFDDVRILHAIYSAVAEEQADVTIHARRIARREHFRRVYEWNAVDSRNNPDARLIVYNALVERFDKDHVRQDEYRQTGGEANFPVRMRQGDIDQAISVSEVLERLPLLQVDYVFVDSQFRDDARQIVEDARQQINQGG